MNAQNFMANISVGYTLLLIAIILMVGLAFITQPKSSKNKQK